MIWVLDSTSTYRNDVRATPPFSSSVSIATGFIFAVHCNPCAVATKAVATTSARRRRDFGDIVGDMIGPNRGRRKGPAKGARGTKARAATKSGRGGEGEREDL